jgi:hypothetical protein
VHDHERRTPPEDPGSPARPARRRIGTLAAAAGGLALGLGAALAGSALLDDGGGDAAGEAVADAGRTVTGEVDSPADLLPDDFPVPPGAGAESPEAAVTGFLDAEVDDDFETSFGYLADADRSLFVSGAGWVASHANELPPIEGYELVEVGTVEDGRALVSTEVRFEPGLDPVIGLTPEEATVEWEVLEGQDGAWGVRLEGSTFAPRYPSEDGVVPAAASWAEARQRCEAPANERGGLVGNPALADQLCDTSGAVDIGEVELLGDADAQPIFTAFGAEAAAAARVVSVDGPASFRVVLVPIGDDWTVVAVLP